MVLAAGAGTRMQSSVAKVLLPLCGRPLLGYVLDAALAAGPTRLVLVVGHQAAAVARTAQGELRAQRRRPWVRVVRQPRLLGSGDAVTIGGRALGRAGGDVVILCGDVPLLRVERVRAMVARHRERQAACTVLTAEVAAPAGYGRVVRDAAGRLRAIVEEDTLAPAQQAIREINVGVYCVDWAVLQPVLRRVSRQGAKREYRFTEVVAGLVADGHQVEGMILPDAQEALGVNTRADLATAHRVLWERTAARLMAAGVTIVDPRTTYVDHGVTVGRETTIYPQTVIESGVRIGTRCAVGPFARLRRGTILRDGAQVGNFTEVTRSTLGVGARMKHHGYLGDAMVGREVNVGAGTITANYDGRTKQRTVIADRASLGSGTILIAPVRVGRGAQTGAGAVVPKRRDVPPGGVVAGVPARALRAGARRARVRRGGRGR